jgi:threonine dehydratase
MIGVQPRNAAAMHRAFAEGRITSVKERPTCADGLAGNLESNSITLAPIRERARGIVLVGERAIERAIAGFVAREQQVVEGSGAVAAAAILEGKLALPGRARAIGIIVTGRNIDADRLKSILNRR